MESGRSPREIQSVLVSVYHPSVCLSVYLSVRLPVLWRAGEAGTDMVSLSLEEPDLAADSRFYLMWTSRVGFQSWLQHMISIMTRAAMHAVG